MANCKNLKPENLSLNSSSISLSDLERVGWMSHLCFIVFASKMEVIKVCTLYQFSGTALTDSHKLDT